MPSRRFGLSLGIDLVPHKTCSFDCIYCQLGPTDRLVATPQDFYNLDDILDDVEEALEDGPRPDVLTLAGSGEPTLFASMGELIDRLRELTDIPVLLITNSSMLWREEVARAALKADIIAPSLDAADERMFREINKPHADISLEQVYKGLRDLTAAHPGKVNLEVMLVRGVNDDQESLAAIARRLEGLRVDRIDINTPVRPPVPKRGALPCDRDTLDRAIERFGPLAHPIGRFEERHRPVEPRSRSFSDLDKDVRETLLRRPSTIEDIAASTGLDREAVTAAIKRLADAGLVDSRRGDDGIYFHVALVGPAGLDRREDA